MSADPVRALFERARDFGPVAARAKRVLLARIAALERLPERWLGTLQETLLFLLAYPDDREVLAGARAALVRLREHCARLPRRTLAGLADTGLPGSATVDTWGLPLLGRLQRLYPGMLEIDWDTLEDSGPLQSAVCRILLGAEVPGLDDITLEWDDWLAAARTRPDQPDLEVLLDLFARAPLEDADREWRFDGCGLPVRWQHTAAGSARGEVVWPCARPWFQARAPERSLGPLPAIVRRAPREVRRLDAEEGERFLDFAAAALAVRQSEIRPLSHGNARDVHLVECGRGLVVALVGVAPDYREALETLTTVLLLRNGVPIAYGPASVSAGCTELGLNLFEEFRGLETRWLYAQYMRALHHVLGSRHFFLTAYGMGSGNPEALHAGSFWFYRRLGFRPANPEVERLARLEEKRLAVRPGARSGLAMLRRLADTSVHLDLSGGERQPLPLGPLGLAVTRRVAREHGGDRGKALARDVRRVTEVLGLGAVPRATLELVAPVLALDRELERRPARERRALARFVRAKAAPSELEADASLGGCSEFLAGLRRAATRLTPPG